MVYLLFNQEALISDGQVTKEKLQSIDQARICCVDVDVMMASAPQDFLDKKDMMLAQKFEGQYSDEYITLHEKIDNNVFQVMGIKAQKIKDIYALIPSSKVDAFVPYAIAIRNYLMGRQTDMTKSIVFVDDLGHEKLITVFEGMKFSRTRTIVTDNAEDILSDIKRSHIDFNKKLGEFAGKKATGDFGLVTNSKPMADNIGPLEPGLIIECLDCRYPALEGLKTIDTQIKYRIHEDIILERKNKESRLRMAQLVLALVISLAGAAFWGFNQIADASLSRDLDQEKSEHSRLIEAINDIDQHIYRDALKRSKNLNYSAVFFEVSGLLPSTYDISSFKFSEKENHWIFDTYLLAQDDQFYDEVPKIKVLKNAEIKDFFIKNRPGKYLKVTL